MLVTTTTHTWNNLFPTHAEFTENEQFLLVLGVFCFSHPNPRVFKKVHKELFNESYINKKARLAIELISGQRLHAVFNIHNSLAGFIYLTRQAV
jgi:glucose-6-phosphate 1-dehydrogenase